MWQTDTDIRAGYRELERRHSRGGVFDEMHYSEQLEARPMATIVRRASARIASTRQNLGRLGTFLSGVWSTLTRQPATRG